MKLRHMFTIFCALWSWPAFAQAFVTGNDLLQKCRAHGGTFESLICTGYVTGVADALQATKLVCFPNNVVIAQAVDIVVKYLGDHPESRHYGAASVAGLALKQAFPCD